MREFLVLKSFVIFRPGSVIVNYRVSWIDSGEMDMDAEKLKEQLVKHLSEEQQQHYYFVPKDSVKVERILDDCHSLG
jgi:hypothetical protein